MDRYNIEESVFLKRDDLKKWAWPNSDIDIVLATEITV
jgi:hypothetical protein